jgi:hypothetical protein
MEHIPLVPGLVIILVTIASLFQCIANNETMERGVTEAVSLIDEITETMFHQKSSSL